MFRTASAALFAPALLAVAACGSSTPEEPVPSDPDDVAAIVEAARQCDIADFADVPAVEIGQPEIHGDPSPVEINAMRSELYIERMGAQPCVYDLPSGLNFRITRAVAAGASPVTGDLVTVHYEGRLETGERFDSSYARGEPACLASDRLIDGLLEALPLMRVGEEWELYIPYQLANGERGRPPTIPPASALAFRMELIDLPDSCPS